MDTNSNIPTEKKVVSVEILHLDELGYGPDFDLTRGQWRALCYENLVKGSSAFVEWQKSWQSNILPNSKQISFDVKVVFENGEIKNAADMSALQEDPFCLDFIGQTFEELNLNSAVFLQDAMFLHCQFVRETNFINASFKKIANFNDSNFVGTANFLSSVFDAYCSFGLVTFSHSNFSNAKFKGKLNSIGTKYLQTANFNDCSFLMMYILLVQNFIEM